MTAKLLASLQQLGENKDVDKQFGDSVYYEDIDEFETQIVDFDNETQPADFEETQIMDLGGDTQTMNDDFVEPMGTQLLDVSDTEIECKSDVECRTQLLDEAVEIPCGNHDQTTSDGGKGGPKYHQDDVGASTEIRSSVDRPWSSGCLRRGFTAIRTASVRTAGLAARRMASKDSDRESCYTGCSSGFYKLCPLNDCGGLSNACISKVYHDLGKNGDEGISNGNKCKIARSLARKLFMVEDVTEQGSCDIQSGVIADSIQLSACDNELTGSTYVDSQEPGELSQANALEFIDKFLKMNVLELDLNMSPENAVSDIVSPGTSAGGLQSVAQQTNLRSKLAGASAFDWDETHEDEGGGAFFVKNKKVLFETTYGSRNYCTESQISRGVELRVGQTVGKIGNVEKQQGLHDKIMSVVRSDSKLVNDRKINQPAVNGENKVDDYTGKQLGVGSWSRDVLASVPDAGFTGLLNAGIHTQVEPEAMDALSRGGFLVTNDGCVAGQNRRKERRCNVEATKKSYNKNGYVVKGPHLSNSNAITRSKRTMRMSMRYQRESSVSSRTRSQYIVKEFNVDLKSKRNPKRLNMKRISPVNDRESSEIVPVNIGGKNVLERGLNNNGSLMVKGQSLRGTLSSCTAATQKIRQQTAVDHSNVVSDGSSDSRGQRNCLCVVQALACENSDARGKASNLTSMTDCSKSDRSGYGGTDVHRASTLVNIRRTKQSLLIESVGHEVSPYIASRTRSRSSTQFAGVEGKGLHSREMSSLENTCQLSSKKLKTCSSSVKFASLHAAIKQSPGEVQKSSDSVNTPPANFKTPSAVSPVCAGDEFPTPSCAKPLSIKDELFRLSSNEHKKSSILKDLRRTREIRSTRVLFSQHLDEDIIRQQKMILSQLGVPVASTISDATHFVAEVFVRTRNMLEAIASGKPIVTRLWLEGCGQAGCLIDEKNFILRDAKVERALRFSMPTSLALASSHPLLEGRRVLITPNIKPDKQIISILVRATCGQAIERLSRTMSNGNKLLHDLLVLSCKEDHKECVPLLEKGIAIYSSELLLNGIITQKLEYERYRIFVDYVKKTRSTIWVKDGDHFLPVNKTK